MEQYKKAYDFYREAMKTKPDQRVVKVATASGGKLRGDNYQSMGTFLDAMDRAKLFWVDGEFLCRMVVRMGVPKFEGYSEEALLEGTYKMEGLNDRQRSVPFDSCWFETGGPIAVINVGKDEQVADDTNNYIVLMGLLAVETSPTTMMVYRYWNGKRGDCPASRAMEYVDMAKINTDETSVVGITETTNDDRVFCSFLAPFIGCLNDGVIGEVAVRGKIKGRLKSEKDRKIKKIIYVSNKKRDRVQCFGGIVPVDWSHRWLVRGHWRKTNRVGKNRAGEYCVNGHTWVVEHQKGPENKPLVSDKIRLVSANA